jgi:hypothetical protein
MNMENSKPEITRPIEGKRIRTSLNLQQIHVDGLSKIAKFQNKTLTAIIDKALTIALSDFNKTTDIDTTLRETNGYIFSRDLDRVTRFLSIEMAKTLIPYQRAYLYCNLKDLADRQRVFKALALDASMQEIDAMNVVLDKAANFNGEQFLGYNVYTIANELRAPMTILQLEYLTLKLGSEAIAKLRERISEKFPDLNIANVRDKATFDETEMNPALETVLVATALSKAAWKALPEPLQKQIHEAVRVGKTDLAKKLASTIGVASEIVDLFPEEQENS